MSMPSQSFTFHDADAVAMLDCLPTGVVVFDLHETIVWANDAASRLLGREVDVLIGMTRHDLAGDLGATSGSSRFRVGLDGRDGRRIECLLRPLPGTLAPAAFIGSLVDVGALDSRRALRLPPLAELEAARLDPQTGLLNRRAILQELSTQVSRSRRYGNPLSVVLLAVRGEASDEQRRTLARTVKGTLRWVDYVGRLDADELLVVLPETTPEAAAGLLAKLRGLVVRALQAPCLDIEGGVAAWQRGDDAMQVVARVTEAARRAVAA